MEWIKKEEEYRVPIQSWCRDVDDKALAQAGDLARHPVIFHHVALMPDCHVGYGMPIGGVIAVRDAVIPNAVGVDIGCGMGAVRTSLAAEEIDREQLRIVMTRVKESVPCGEGRAHRKAQQWDVLEEALERCRGKGWFSEHVRDLAVRNLGTLGGGNHFIEIQAGDEGRSYIDDMNLALRYAEENRRRILDRFTTAVQTVFPKVEFESPVNIHHNYAALENHFNTNVWVHRKGATSARSGEAGIIPGSMGTPSYIVRGLGNPESFMSCSHGAGRVMGRKEASRSLTPEACDEAMRGIVFDRWNKIRRGREKGRYDLGEAPQAYKNIHDVITAELDLIQPMVKLRPLAVVKG
jgi:tRNA-splicing ligase RtcB